MAITLQTIATHSGVSKGTVSEILRNPKHERYSVAMRQRILRAAKELKYVRNRAAAAVRTGRTSLIGLVIPWNNPELLDGLQQHCQGQGFATMLEFTPHPDLDAEERAITSAIERRVDGLLWMPADGRRDYAKQVQMLRQAEIPTVLLENKLLDFGESTCVWSHEQAALQQLLRGLEQQGYQRLCFCKPTLGSAANETCAAMLLDLAGESSLDVQFVATDSSEAMMRQAERQIAAARGPLALLCEADWLGIESLRLCQRLGKRVPDEVGIIIRGDLRVGGKYRIGELVDPALTALRIPYDVIAEVAVERLMAGIRTDESFAQTTPPPQVQLVWRQSTDRMKLNGGSMLPPPIAPAVRPGE